MIVEDGVRSEDRAGEKVERTFRIKRLRYLERTVKDKCGNEGGTRETPPTSSGAFLERKNLPKQVERLGGTSQHKGKVLYSEGGWAALGYWGGKT